MNRTVMLVLLGAASADFAFQQTISPALTRIQSEFDASTTAVAWVVTAFLLAGVLSLAVIGPIGDRVGRKPAFAGSLGLFAAGAVICALAQSIGMLIAGRLIQGLGAGMAALSLAIVKDNIEPDTVPRAVGILIGAAGVGGVVGTLLSGVLADRVSIAAVFWAQAAVSAAIGVAVLRAVPASPIYAKARFDWQAGVLLVVALAALMLAISQSNAWGWSSGRILGLLAVAATAFVGWVARERSAAVPLVGLPLMRRTTIWTANLAGFVISLVAIVPLVLVPLIAGYPKSTGYGLGLDSTEVALVLSPSSLAVLFAGLYGGRLVCLIGARRQAMLGGIAIALSYLLLIVLPSTAVGLGLAVLPLGIGMGLGIGAIVSLMLSGSSAEEAGVTSGLNSVVRIVGQALGPQVAIAIVVAAPALAPGVSTFQGFEDAFVVGLVASLFAVVTILVVPAARKDPLTTSAARSTDGDRRPGRAVHG